MQAEREAPVVPEQVEPHNTKQRRRGNLIRKKHITLCFSLFLALSMVLGQLIPVAAIDEIPAEEPQAEQTEPAAEEPAAEPEPEVTTEEEPGVVPIEGTDPVQDEQPADEGQAPAESGEAADPVQDSEEAKPEEEEADSIERADTGTVPVYIYVAAQDEYGQPFSKEMLELLQLGTTNVQGYFAAGTVHIDPSKLGNDINGKIRNAEDWEYVIRCLRNSFDPQNSIDHPNNLIGDYIDMIQQDIATQNSGKQLSGMWLSDIGANFNGTSLQGNRYIGGRADYLGKPFDYGRRCWHLDLRFKCAKITYLYGNNGLSGEFQDLKEIGSKVFIEGATMDYEPTINIPAGYRVVGYYTDPDFAHEWTAKGLPITGMDNKVYVKVVPENDVEIHYVVKEGEGTVTDPSKTSSTDQEGWDYFNPKLNPAESPEGSTAIPAADWTFEGWYSDAELKTRIADAARFVPTAPDAGWDNKVTYTYYAKFVPQTKKIYVANNIVGNAGDRSKQFTYHLEIKNGENPVTTPITLTNGNSLHYSETVQAHTFTLMDGEYIETEELPQYYSFVVTQQNTSNTGSHDDGYSTSLATNCNNPSGSLSTNSHGHALNHTDLANADRAEVVFTNEKSMAVPTGMNDHDSALHGLILSAGAGLLLLGAIVMIRRRMNAI